MAVISFTYGPLENNSYIVHNGKDAVIIDPSTDTEDMLDFISTAGLKLHALLLTHMHFDHVPGCAAMMKATGLPVYAGAEDISMAAVHFAGARMFGLPPVKPFDATKLKPARYTWGALECEVIHAPGHSEGSLCYYFPQEKALVSGDVLFYHSVGRTDFAGGDAEKLLHTLHDKLLKLPPETVVWPGHGPETSISDEAAHNPYCRV